MAGPERRFSIEEARKALEQNRLTAVVVSEVGEIVALEAFDMDLPSEAVIDDVMPRHRRDCVSFLPRAVYTSERLIEIIRESVEAIQLGRSGKLRPGANIVRQ